MSTSQSRGELVQHLIEQVQFMKSSIDSYDSGFEAEAKRLATSIRILVHDTNKSTSVLKILGIKDRLDYYSYLKLEDHTKTIAFVGLSMGFVEGGLSYFSMTGEPKYKISFDEWWNQQVIINRNKNIDFTRRKIILAVTNTDGGAHVDPTLNERYASLSRKNGFGWERSSEDSNNKVVVNGPELSIVRQTAYELYLTIINQIDKLI